MIFKSRNKYLIEYQVGKTKIYNYIIKGISEKNALDKFGTVWVNNYVGLYPFPVYKIISIKKIDKKLEIS